MPLTAFPEPKDLNVDFVHQTGDSQPQSFNRYDVSNPHPGFGKDPNILNEFGHTKFPMWVKDKDGVAKIAKNEEEKAAIEGDIPAAKTELNQNGPTIAEYVAKGYKAETYPPEGYAAKSTPDEVDAFIKAAAAWK